MMHDNVNAVPLSQVACPLLHGMRSMHESMGTLRLELYIRFAVVHWDLRVVMQWTSYLVVMMRDADMRARGNVANVFLASATASIRAMLLHTQLSVHGTRAPSVPVPPPTLGGYSMGYR
jgi:hypothetical protein